MKKSLVPFIIVLGLIFTTISCRETKSDKEKAEDAIENTAEEIEDAAEDVEDEIEDAADDVKEELDGNSDDN
ncbi:hypothetical protein LV716_02530 [Flagellimonas sp. HMM57]|uniref:hypothetical protein n=1 Tax=unclassified Flagellimonas TaxID=2644544 RepID=UPI0013D43FB4|nr:MULTISPECIES: hypothetical protein [unclassified Flagellimonas]UII76682.1 hypothetical protein LV716_02530 [Flagellimonas sp. HMM57]